MFTLNYTKERMYKTGKQSYRYEAGKTMASLLLLCNSGNDLWGKHKNNVKNTFKNIPLYNLHRKSICCVPLVTCTDA